ncbi:jg3336 [Pararge aegeria aegeria]|uniref:Jg3336 protein n=1 Tax=Pararge aegeria aegeria TaxID=348720 RepID=A0A8S4RVL0_9NEOP|nr:jg3336 [Pararge aegeria aegeria]
MLAALPLWMAKLIRWPSELNQIKLCFFTENAMPEDCKIESLAQLVDDFEDYTLNAYNYQVLHSTLDLEDQITAPTAEKLLRLCIRDRIEDLKYAAHVLSIISTLITKFKDGKCPSLPNFVPSLLAVLNVLKTTALVDSVEALKKLCFDTIISYPDDTLICLCENHSDEIYEIMNLYCHRLRSTKIGVQSIILVGKLLKILPSEQKATFVRNGIKVWFSGLIPFVVQQSVEIEEDNSDTMLNLLETLELLTDELIQFDYLSNDDWQKVLENIHTAKRYPAIMKSLLEKGSDYWHRLWIVFIKLLKNQITKCTNTTSSPINALLPCVEKAFKMDIRNRCRAFLCWNMLISNFAKETHEAFLNKRLRLLIVPLASNNAKDCDKQLLNIVVNVLIPTLFNKSPTIQHLMKATDDPNPPIQKIIALLNNLPLDSLEDRQIAKTSIKTITDWMFIDALQTSSNSIEWFVKKLSSNGMIMWTAMAESMCISAYSVCPRLLVKMYLWPFKYTNNFVDKEDSTTAWLNLYNTLGPNLQMKSGHKDIVNALTIHCDNQSTCLFFLNATIAILDHKLQKEDTDMYKEMELIVQLTKQINELQIEKVLPSLSSFIVHTLNSLSKNTNVTIAEHIMSIVNNILKVCNVMFKQQKDYGSELLKHIEDIFISLKSILESKSYAELKSHLVDQLKECAPYFKNHKGLSNHILAIYKTSNNENLLDNIAKEIIEAFEIVEESITLNHQKQLDPENFTTPSKVAKKSKKEASIINTVVENGEEFVVVKSNWKFNPRNLTENQKEKFQRKREDIPALYQDLSQSQDEFKLSTWKTDSQDTSTASTKSTNTLTNEDVSAILKNIPNTDILPKIMENVTSGTAESGNVNLNVSHTTENNKTKDVQRSVKDPKSPRMALKDRVFRNVRNLIENSNIGECNDVNSGNTKNISNTPVVSKKKTSINITKSAPSQLNLERPSRVKRKPKKFDDLHLISLTKGRHSNINSSQTDVNITENQVMPDSSNVDNIDKDNNDIAIDASNKKSMIDYNENSSENNLDTILDHDELGKKVIKTTDCFFSKKTLLNEMDKAGQDPNNIAISMPLGTQITETDQDVLIPHDTNNIDEPENDENNEGNAYTDDDLNGPATPKSNKTNEIIEKCLTDTQSKVLVTSNLKEDANEKDKKYPDEMKTNVVPTPMANIMKDTIKDNLGPDINKNDTVCTPNDKMKRQIDENICSEGDNTNAVSTSKVDKVKDKQKVSCKKTKKKSRIESQLAIDMVEGHPFLKVQSEKRLTRMTISNSPYKRKRLSFNSESTAVKRRSKSENKISVEGKSTLIKDSLNTEEIAASQDFIESSQDSTVTAISVKPAKVPGKKNPIVLLNDLKHAVETGSQNLISDHVNIHLSSIEGNSDIELPSNKTNLANLTEEMDTEPIDCNTAELLRDDEYLPTAEIFEVVVLDRDTLNTTDADTQPVDPDIFIETNISEKPFDADQNTTDISKAEAKKINDDSAENVVDDNDTNASLVTLVTSAEDITKTLSESVLLEADKEDSSSSCNNDQRKKDFFYNILQISPIKSMSPVQDQVSPTPETSSDYVVIKLASPVQSNGEPFEILESPEIFTEDNASPDKRDRSPPREEVCAKITSPSSSLSLKRNRPQMRSGGRAAQMLGLCVPDRLQTLMVSEKPTDAEEAKKSPSLNTPARRNLRILYNSSSGENDNSEETEDSENFLKFKRSLPTTDCSPSGPILKRKLNDITDESTTSPASKRKRVSFHDPPVSTTICVKKYIEQGYIRSPQNSANKRLERQARAQIATKSPRRLENVFKLDSVLNKAVESFSEANDTQSMSADTEMSSLDETPIVEVIKTSDLNDRDPICLELVNCEDRIENIAAELSSPAMKTLLVNTFDGKVETIGDLAKMTELEINRLCIKAPKVQVAKSVLYEYLSKNAASVEVTSSVDDAISESTKLQSQASVEVQTETTLVESIQMQTECVAVTLASSQTDPVVTAHCFVQTNESGSKSTATIITDCLSERPDFVERLNDCMDETSKHKIVENLSCNTLINIIMEKMSERDGKHVLSILQDRLTERLNCNDIILFCSSLLKKVHDKPA